MIIIVFFLVIINLFLWGFAISDSVGVMTKKRLARRRTIVAMIIIVVAAMAIIYPVASMLGGSVSSKQVSRTVPEVKLGNFWNVISTMAKNLVPIEGKRVKIDQEVVDNTIKAYETKDEDGLFPVYSILVEGTETDLAKIGEVGDQWLYLDPNDTSVFLIAEPATGENSLKGTVGINPKDVTNAIKANPSKNATGPYPLYELNHNGKTGQFAKVGTVGQLWLYMNPEDNSEFFIGNPSPDSIVYELDAEGNIKLNDEGKEEEKRVTVNQKAIQDAVKVYKAKQEDGLYPVYFVSVEIVEEVIAEDENAEMLELLDIADVVVEEEPLEDVVAEVIVYSKEMNLAKVGEVGNQWLYMNPEDTSETYVSEPASEEGLTGITVAINQKAIDSAINAYNTKRESGPYSVYEFEHDGEIVNVAKIGKIGKQWLYMDLEDTSTYFLDVPASEQQRVKAVKFTWSNYPDALKKGDFGRYVINSIILVVINTIGALLSSTLVAYGFSRFKFKGRNWMFIVLLSTMMLPAQVSLIPSFIIYTKLGWYGTYLPLTVAAYFAASPWNVFLMRQFFMGLPLELDEAAKIDGCGPVGILARVIVPQSTAVMLTITLSTAVFWWNDYFYSLIYLQDQKLYPVALGLTAFDAKYFNNSALKAAATVMMLVPPILMFFFFQKFFIQGTVISGVKG